MNNEVEIVVEHKQEDTPLKKREKPVVLSEEDKPFTSNGYGEAGLLEIREQEHGHGVEDFKNKVSSRLIYGGIAIIIAVTLIGVFVADNYDFLEKTFEFAKTIVTMSIGFLLADTKKK